MVRLLLSLLFASALWMGLGSSPVRGQEGDSTPAAHPLVGSWLVGVDVEGNPPLLLPNLASFTADGVVVVAAPPLLPELPGGTARNLFSSGHGAWTSTSAEEAEVRFAFLVVDEDGNPVSLNVIDGHVQVGEDGESYTGEYTLTIHPASGEAEATASGTWRATRIAPESDMLFPGVEPEATPVP
jgi:hypothetical protein